MALRTLVWLWVVAVLGCASGGEGPGLADGGHGDGSASMDATNESTPRDGQQPDRRQPREAGGGDAGCQVDDDCPGVQPVCNDANGTCVDFSPTQCSPCGPDGGCADDAFCLDYNDQRFCAKPCVRGIKCPEGFSCIEGPSARRLCAPSEGMSCEGDTCDFVQCDTGLQCKPDTGECVQCIDDNDCGSSGACNDQNVCVGCLSDGDCPAGRCDTDTDMCVQCLLDEDCTNGRCDPNNKRCVQCLDDGDCTNGRCRPSSQSCVECLEEADCAASGEHCKQSSNRCVECLNDGHCDGTDACSGDRCVETSRCSDDTGCTGEATCNDFTSTCTCDDGCKPSEVMCISFIPPMCTCQLPEEC